jgi:quinohemoprotein ethanol dehydrogenase
MIAAGLCLVAAASHAQDSARIKQVTATVDAKRIQNADSEPGNWLTHGRTYSEQRYSPLDKINDKNIGELGLGWALDLDTNRGLEATPIVVDGVIFASGPWSVVWAVDGRTGKLLWTFDPEVPRQWGRNACCDVVNRGVAVWKGKVYVGTLDGRLIAIDAATGKKAWEADTLIDRSRPYTITGAPRIANGKVIIGNGGAELGVRGYVTAYDAETGKQVWRFFTVPGNPAEPAEDAAMARALPTWHGRWWETGGGGTVWDAIVYDPELDLVYLGVGNGSPWAQQARSPGGGDNLYLSSIVALRADSGEMVWWYQTTPGDTWDYTATQPIILADLQIEGKTRKVLMQAPKNGFFYVLERRTGQLISAEKFATVTWASGVDKTTGRPIEIPSQRYFSGPAVVFPSAFGAHSWHPMSFSPKTGLVYIPAMEIPGVYNAKDYKYDKRTWNLGTDTLETFTAFPPEVAAGSLLAWDPVKQKEAWRIKYETPWNGGTLVTAGNLVFHGVAKGGKFVAYTADSGKKVWEFDAQTGVVAGPVSWSVDGEQYITVMAGWGGVFSLLGGDAAKATGVRYVGRMLTFKLGGKQTLKPLAELPAIPVPPPLPAHVTEATLKEGSRLYHMNCLPCHGPGAVGAGQIRDIRHTDASMFDSYPQILLEGAFVSRGMPKFDDILSKEEVEKIRYFVQAQAIADHEKRNKVPATKR